MPAEGSADAVMERLEAAMATSNGTIIARIDHGAGAASVGMPVGDNQLLIFGNPRLGTPAIADDPLAGLFLPLKVLVYEDVEGQTWIAYMEVEEMFKGLDVDADAESVRIALDGFVQAARDD